MRRIPNADDQSDDRFGYSCYALVFPVSGEIQEETDPIERASGSTRAKIPAHVTVKGTFCGIESLSDLRRLVRFITGNTRRFHISFEGAESVWRSAGGGLRVPVRSEMQALHDALVAGIVPISTSAYIDDPYWPHMTYVQEVSVAALEQALQLVAHADFGDGFWADSIDLMGRVGKAHGGRWELIEQFPLAGTD